MAGIVAGLLLEGGNLGQILQPTAALIVFGGTLGAVLLQFPLLTVVAAFRGTGAHVDGAGRSDAQADRSSWWHLPTRRAAKEWFHWIRIWRPSRIPF